MKIYYDQGIGNILNKKHKTLPKIFRSAAKNHPLFHAVRKFKIGNITD